MDDNTSTESLVKAIGFFKHLHNVHLAQEEIDHTQLMSDNVQMVTAATDCVGLEIKKLRLLMQVRCLTLVRKQALVLLSKRLFTFFNLFKF